MLPVRLRNITITNGTNHNPIVTDNFVLLPLTGELAAGKRIVIEFTGQPLERLPTNQGGSSPPLYGRED
jgi:hypothetical protein